MKTTYIFVLTLLLNLNSSELFADCIFFKSNTPQCSGSYPKSGGKVKSNKETVGEVCCTDLTALDTFYKKDKETFGQATEELPSHNKIPTQNSVEAGISAGTAAAEKVKQREEEQKVQEIEKVEKGLNAGAAAAEKNNSNQKYEAALKNKIEAYVKDPSDENLKAARDYILAYKKTCDTMENNTEQERCMYMAQKGAELLKKAIVTKEKFTQIKKDLKCEYKKIEGKESIQILRNKKSCENNTMCVGTAICERNGESFELNVVCNAVPSKSLQCPDASDCLNDGNIELLEIEKNTFEKDSSLNNTIQR